MEPGLVQRGLRLTASAVSSALSRSPAHGHAFDAAPVGTEPRPVASDEQSAERFQYGREHSQPWRRAPSERRRGPENSGQSTAHRSTRILVEAARYGLRGRASPGRSCSRSRLSSRRRPRPARCTRQQFGRTDAAGRPPLPPLRSGRYARPAVPSLRSARYTSKTLSALRPGSNRASKHPSPCGVRSGPRSAAGSPGQHPRDASWIARQARRCRPWRDR